VVAIGPGSRYLLIALLGLGLGVQNAAAQALAVPDLTTTDNIDQQLAVGAIHDEGGSDRGWTRRASLGVTAE
jgi:hypothetical protein